jgi:hypothetical protein
MGRRRLIAWEAGSGLVIILVGSFLHFFYELSGFATYGALFGSVNESTWEHLKLFFWPGVIMAVVQHAYIRDRVNNFWTAKAASLFLTPVGVIVSFYFYLGIVIPINGKGELWATIGTAVFGVALGQYGSYRLLRAEPIARSAGWIAGVSIILLGVAMVVFTWQPPRVFLFENFAGYRYLGEYGILDDYTPYLVFR